MPAGIGAIKYKDLSLSTALTWVGSATAYGWPLIIWVALWPLITGATGEQIPGSEIPINIHIYDLLNGLIPAAVLTVFRFVFKANRSAEYSGSTAKNASVQVLAAIVGVTLTLVIVASLGSLPPKFIASAPIGMLSTWGQIFTFTIVIMAIAELRSATKQLARKTYRLGFLRANLEARVIHQREALQLEVDLRVGEQVGALREQLDELQRSDGQSELAAKLSSRISDTIDAVVRPLSLEIANSVNDDTRAEVRSLREIERRISKLPLRQRMELKVYSTSVFNVAFAGIFLLVFMLPTYGYLFESLAIFQVALPAAISSTLLIWLAGRLTKGLKISYWSALIVGIFAAVIAAIPFAVLNRVILNDQDPQLLDFLAFGAFLGFVFVFYGSLFYQAAYQILDRVTDANRELRKLVAFLQNEFQINRRTLAQLVHGKVQARLQAASIRLKQADKITDELIAAIQADLNATILDTVDTSLDAQSAEALLTDMADQWSGICDLTFSLGGRVSSIVNENPTLKVAVVEVVREAVNNAVKHGEADEADIEIFPSGAGAVVIEIRNKVYSTSQNDGSQSRGYGSQLLDQITDSWSIRFEDGDAIFEATISIGGTNL